MLVAIVNRRNHSIKTDLSFVVVFLRFFHNFRIFSVQTIGDFDIGKFGMVGIGYLFPDRS